ncbi:MAG: cysteine--tRNA ligase, partial [Nitrosopumilaceae archaeon]
MKIQDTLSGEEKKLESGKVRIYLCGMTVYDESHVGHARTLIVFDVLRRYLESNGIEVEFIQNFTDVDDKIINRAKRENVRASAISSRYIQEYYDEFDALNVKRATKYPKATEHIQDMLDLVQDLVDKKIAYVSKNGVYFSVSMFPGYGKLSKKKVEDLQSGARVEVDEAKNDPLDFALWKFSESDPSWNSPWGRGRPGWHIECSTMSLKYLGENFEIHGGGRDLIFPHHENEIAQSESHTSKPFAKIWMHVGMITINGEKMSKSLGNIKSVKNLIKTWSPNVLRVFCIAGHYSKPIDYSEELLKEHETNWNKARLAYHKLIQAEKDGEIEGVDKTLSQLKTEFSEALDDNLNTHMALSTFYRLVTFCLSQEDHLTKSA